MSFPAARPAPPAAGRSTADRHRPRLRGAPCSTSAACRPPAPTNIASPIVPAVAPAEGGTAAHIQVIAPNGDVTILFNGRPMANREFDTPALAEGKAQTFTVRALWNEGSRLVSSERVVDAKAGAKIVVDFTKR